MREERDEAIVAQDVVKEYRVGGTIVRALDGVTFALNRGLLAAIVGPSGSGKTTLLNLLGALDVPTSGDIFIGGVNLKGLGEQELTAHRRARVGFVFQRFNLIPNRTALENVMLPMEFVQAPRAERRERAQRLLAAVGMAERAAQWPSRLSGGEQQRVAIARALANDPSLILADEPTGNLDAATGQAIVTLLGELARKRQKTVVVVTHNAAIAALADVTLAIKDGKLSAG